MEQKNKISRRAIVKGFGAGLGVLAITPVLAGSEKLHLPVADDLILEDPTTKYPRPPFKEQSQPWPGLAGRMEPRPDHGESTYKGSGRLMGRKALITGEIQEWAGQRLLLMQGKGQT